jgi:hypothetical protein
MAFHGRPAKVTGKAGIPSGLDPGPISSVPIVYELPDLDDNTSSFMARGTDVVICHSGQWQIF